MNLAHNNLKRLGFPIRKSPDHCLFASFPKLIAGYYVLYRLLLPRHPPYALYLLDYATLNDFTVAMLTTTLEYLNIGAFTLFTELLKSFLLQTNGAESKIIIL